MPASARWPPCTNGSFPAKASAWTYALADTGYTMTEIQCSAYLGSGEDTPRKGNGRGTSNIYRAADGWVLLSAQSNNIWPRFCGVIGKPDWVEDPRFATRSARDENC